MIIQKPSKNLGKDLKSPDSNVVPVQVRPRAPIKSISYSRLFFSINSPPLVM